MGEVYLAEDTKLNRKVALKFLPVSFSRNDEFKKRFVHEAQTASSLEHPNICTIHEIGETEDERLYIVMPHYVGETLKSKINKGPIAVEETLNIISQIAKGLEKAHQKGIVHRDIKPANIFITIDGIVKILDFGLSKSTTRDTLTQMGSTLGTVSYMSPEQTRGGNINQTTDIWSLGVVLYEMITGQLPFKGEYDQAVIYSILQENPESINKLEKKIPSSVIELVNKMIEKNPIKRIQSCSEILSRINKNLEKDGTTLEMNAVNYLKNKLAIKILFSVVIAAIAFTVLYYSLFRNPEVSYNSEPVKIAVISARNLTGDPSLSQLEKIIPSLLITNLDKSQFFRILTWERMRDLLRQLGKEDSDFINEDLGFQISNLDGIDAIVIPSYMKMGDMYVIDIKVLNVHNKELIKSAKAEGRGAESIFDQIDVLSEEIAKGIGLTSMDIESAKLRISDVTTSSMEAYENYIRGQGEFGLLNWDKAIPHYKRAVELDSTFASAYLGLGMSYYYAGDYQAEIKYTKKAYENLDKATEREKLQIKVIYANIVERDMEKTLKISEEICVKYPKDSGEHFRLGYFLRFRDTRRAIKEIEIAVELNPHNSPALNLLVYLYINQSEYGKARKILEQYVSTFPDEANPYDTFGDYYFMLGNLEEAEAKYARALSIDPSFNSAPKLAYIYALKENYTKAINEISEFLSLQKLTGTIAEAYPLKALFCCYNGQFNDAYKNLDSAINYAKTISNEIILGRSFRLSANLHLDRKEYELSRKDFNIAYKHYFIRNPESKNIELNQNFYLGLLDIKTHLFDSVIERLNRMKQLDNNYNAFTSKLELELLLAKGETDAVIDSISKQKPSKFDMENFRDLVGYNLPFEDDLLARGYLAKGDIDSAVREYERLLIIDPKTKDRRLINPIYHYRLAKICEQVGKFEKAKAEYKKFLELWKDADEDLSELIDAKDRLTKLTKVN